MGACVLTVFVCLVEPGVFDGMDFVRLHGLYKSYIQEAVAAGRLPLWNPHIWLGRPFLADVETAFFYPPDLLYLFLELHLACLVTCALHLLLGLYGAVKLGRGLGMERAPSLAVAFAFVASAPIVGAFAGGLIHYASALCYLPLLLYLGLHVQARPSRRSVAGLGLLLGLQFLCGHPQAFWIGLLGLGTLLVGRRLGPPWGAHLTSLAADLGLVLLALMLGLGVAGVALLPLLELISQGNRPASSVALAAAFAEPGFGWATLFMPSSMPAFHVQLNAQLYAGLVPLVAGVAGLLTSRRRNTRALLVLGVLAGLIAAGESTPFFRLFYYVIPGLGRLRIHSRNTVLVTLALVMLAGLFLSARHTRGWRAIAVATLLALAANVAFALGWPGYGTQVVGWAVQRALWVLATGVLLVLWLRGQTHSRRARVVEVALVLLMAADGASAIHALKPQFQDRVPARIEAQTRAGLVHAKLAQPFAPPPRVFVPQARENAGMGQGWSSPYGYSSLAPDRVWRHLHQAVGVPIPLDRNTYPSSGIDGLGPFPYDSMNLVLGADRYGRLVSRDDPDPRAYVVGAARTVRNPDEATRLMRARHDFHRVALIEQDSTLPADTRAPAGEAHITRFEPERVEVSVRSHSAGLLIVAEPWYPGWSARVDGREQPCLPANAWMRAVPVPAGASEVVLTFRSTYLLRGALLSLLALVLAVLLITRRRQVRSPAPGTS